PLSALPRAVARRLVRRAIECAKGDLRSLDFEHTGRILELASTIEGHDRMQAPGIDVYRSFEWIRFAPPGLDRLDNRNFRVPLTVPGRVGLPGLGTALDLKLIENTDATSDMDCVYNGEMACLDWAKVRGRLELRNWRPGDEYRPVGQGHSHKLKALFQLGRVPLWERRNWPILTSDEHIVWA